MVSEPKINVVQGTLQLISFIVTCLLFVVIFYKPFITFYGFDQLPKVKPYPKQSHADTPVVYMGILINNFSEFNIESGSFEMNGSVWFQYNPEQISFEKIKKFHVVNGEMKYISEGDIRKVGKEEVALFEINVAFKNDLNYSAFPLDDHYITIGIFNYELPDGTIVKSEMDNFDLSDTLSIPGWRVMDRQLKVGYLKRTFGEKNSHSSEEVQTYFILQCKRSNPVILITILFAIMIILLTGMLPLSIEAYDGNLIAGAVGGIVALRFVLTAMSPAYVGYFMLSDYLFIFALISVIAAAVGCLVARQFNWSVFLQNILLIGIYGGLLLGSFASIFLV